MIKKNKNNDKEKLINIALKFLQNPAIQDKSDEQKISFLKKKGIYLKKLCFFFFSLIL